MDMHEAANKLVALGALKQFASAFDPSYCCERPTALRFVPAAGSGALAFMDTETRELRFRVHDKALSLHKERAVLDAASGLPLGTLRQSLLHRTPTYSAYARTEHEESPETFQFAVESGGRLRMNFHDLVADQRAVLGADLVADKADADGPVLEFWVARGQDEVREAVARIRYSSAKDADGKAPASPGRGGVLEVAKGVDLLMMVLLCVALDDHRRHKTDKTTSPPSS
jgi:hypothetical protein